MERTLEIHYIARIAVGVVETTGERKKKKKNKREKKIKWENKIKK